MSTQQLVFLIIVFGIVFGIALLAMFVFAPSRMRQRLASMAETNAGAGAQPDSGWIDRVAEVAKPFAKLSIPEEGWEKSILRTRFMNAGWRNPSAPAVFFAAKTVLAVVLPVLSALFAAPRAGAGGSSFLMLLLVICAGIGYYLPSILLSHTVERRQREIFENFPDALDLLTVCIEAGLSLDSALEKVADEIHIKSLVLSQELKLVLLEMRGGLSKEKALRNLALRTGVEDIDALVGMLIQSDRFGTSMVDSLRVHSDNLRTKRRLRAEEAAAKVALKLLFPLLFFIFPTLLLVIIGPAMIQIYQTFLPALAGHH